MVDVATLRVRADDQAGHAEAVPVPVHARRHGVVVEAAPVVPRQEDGAGGPVRP